MVDFALTRWTSSRADYDKVLEEMELKLETVDNTKTIILAQISKRGHDFVGMLLYTN